MRKTVAAMVMMAGVQGAQAADMPDYALRGGYSDIGVRGPNWEGFYVGGQAAQGWMKTKPPIGYNADIEAAYVGRTGAGTGGLSNFPSAEGRKAAFGGFVGYNSQWEDVVVGVEANYLHSDIAANSILRTPVGSPAVGRSNVNVALTDFGSLRLRGGYMVGSFLPYAFIGFAAGSADMTRSVGLTSNGGVAVTAPFETRQKTLFVYGGSAGVGLDVLLVGGLFARAEYEYSQFTSKVNVSVNTVKVGLGYRF